MNNPIYLDNNATTRVDPLVLEAMMPFFKDEYGNPSSLYDLGTRAKQAIDSSRQTVARLIGAQADEIIFTSSGSEGNTTAIMSAVRSNLQKKHIITTTVEHSSILETCKYLESIGYQIDYLSVDRQGRLDLAELESLVKEDTLLVSVMLANNETGNIYPVREITKIAKKYNILVHTDAVQAVGKIPVNVEELGVDYLSFSGHKIHAPKGIAVLYLKKGTPYIPLIFGHQEKDRRGGTENVAYIAGIGRAAQIILDDKLASAKNVKSIRDNLERQIRTKIEGVRIYGDPENRLTNTTNMAFEGIRGEELLISLNQEGVYVSTGSACNLKDLDPSHVLVAMKADLDKSSPIRISLDNNTSTTDINNFVDILVRVINTLRSRNK